MIFDLIKNKEFTKLFKYIEDNPTVDLDIQDTTYNYFIHYVIMYNLYDLLNFILSNRTIRLDILDIEGHNLLYIPIKYNYINILKLLLEYDSKTIGVSIIDTRDNLNNTGLHYCIIFNNIAMFKLLFSVVDESVFLLAFQRKNTSILLYLLKKNDYSKIFNTNGESLLQLAITYGNDEIIDEIISNNTIQLIINNAEHEYGLTALHHCVILKKNKLALQLMEKGARTDISDYMGNTPLHYAMIEQNYQFVEQVLLVPFNGDILNLNGDTILHLFLEDSNVNEDNTNLLSFLLILIKSTNLNIMNNSGNTPLHIIVKKNLFRIKQVATLLGTINMDLFIKNRDNVSILDNCNPKYKDELIGIVTDSYYNILTTLKNTNKLTVDWEKYCATNDIANINKLWKKKGNTAEHCKKYIENMIRTKQRSLPQYKQLDLQIDSGIYKDGCFYTGSTIDILFGLVYLYNNYSNIVLLLEYPLTQNKELENYYKTHGFNNKLDFLNIEINWSFQKIIYIANFDSILMNADKTRQFIVIPIGIEVAIGSHANVIIIDNKNKTIERFEPNGKYAPRQLNYNAELLDSLLINKFSQLLSEYTYYPPIKYLPDIGFQILEDEKCKKIGDPNGFCAVWCIWWTDMRLKYPNVKLFKLAKELITQIKLSNKSFKSIIRNYSQNIVEVRDSILKKHGLTIDDILNDKYDDTHLTLIENDVLNIVI